jgi:uncharacterized membrane protein
MADMALNETEEKKLRDLATLVYVLQAVGFAVGITWIVAVIINYVKIDVTRGSWLETHFNWQIRTFWFGLVGWIVGMVTAMILIGWVILAVVTLWAIYRVVKGWLYLNDRKPMYPGLV